MSQQQRSGAAVLYALRLEGDTEIRYIGQTAGSAETRLYTHKYCARRGDKRPVYFWMRKYGTDRIVAETLLISTPEEVDRYEIEVIASLRSASVRLLNLAEGGRVNRGWHQTDASKVAIAKSAAERVTPELIEKMKYGRMQKPWTQAQIDAPRQNIQRAQEARRGSRNTADHNAAIARARIGKISTLDSILRMSSTKRGRPLTDAETQTLTANYHRRLESETA